MKVILLKKYVQKKLLSSQITHAQCWKNCEIANDASRRANCRPWPPGWYGYDYMLCLY